MDYNVTDSTTISMYKGILSIPEISEVVAKKDITPSSSVVVAFSLQEGESTSFIPEISYEGTKFLKIPPQYASGGGGGDDEELDKKFEKQCKNKGLCKETIEKIKLSMPETREWQHSQIINYMKSKDFQLQEGETMEEAYKSLSPPYFPFVFFKNDAVPECGPLIIKCKSLGDAEIRVIRVSMPPGDLDAPLYGSYVELCMRVLCNGMKVTSTTKISFSFRVIPQENKIVFYICPLHGKEDNAMKQAPLIV
jgi:hypothetical protein